MARFTPADILALLALGLSVTDIAGMDVPAAASPVAGTPVVDAPAKVAPAWLVARGERKANRRALAATLRADGVDLSTDAGKAAWAKAKADAGITKAEKAAHRAFVAGRKAAKA